SRRAKATPIQVTMGQLYQCRHGGRRSSVKRERVCEKTERRAPDDGNEDEVTHVPDLPEPFGLRKKQGVRMEVIFQAREGVRSPRCVAAQGSRRMRAGPAPSRCCRHGWGHGASSCLEVRRGAERSEVPLAP